ncbi:MAG TPA: hypothetical protein VF331_05745 [Polyangiales bacterium]
MKHALLVLHTGLLVACAASHATQPPPVVPAEPPGSSSSTPAADVAAASPAVGPAAATPAQVGARAHRLAIAAAACWFGGVWSDAEGAGEVERSDTSKRHCRELVAQAYGNDDAARFERLRAVDAVEVSELASKLDAAAHSDALDAAHTAHLRALLIAIADAEREAMYARRAGDKVKDDIAVPKPSPKRKADETSASVPLSERRSFDAMLAADVGDLSHELRAFTVLFAMDRLQQARGLPKHLKVLAVSRAMTALFGVAAPNLPEDPTRPPAGGAWLAYLTSIAKTAGHPVPEQAKSLHDRELLAWGGTLMGLADKLRAEVDGISAETDLQPVVRAVIRRLETQYRADEAAMLNASEHGSGAPATE